MARNPACMFLRLSSITFYFSKFQQSSAELFHLNFTITFLQATVSGQ